MHNALGTGGGGGFWVTWGQRTYDLPRVDVWAERHDGDQEGRVVRCSDSTLLRHGLFPLLWSDLLHLVLPLFPTHLFFGSPALGRDGYSACKQGREKKNLKYFLHYYYLKQTIWLSYYVYVSVSLPISHTGSRLLQFITIHASISLYIKLTKRNTHPSTPEEFHQTPYLCWL